MTHVIPQDDETRKNGPMYRGLLGYFPAALFRVASHSFRSDRKHNPDKPESEAPHWARGKSSDHADCIVRHLAEMHTDPLYHMTAIAWRSLAMLQEYLESLGAGPGSRAVFPDGPRPEDNVPYPAQKLAGKAFADELTSGIRVGRAVREKLERVVDPDGHTVRMQRALADTIPAVGPECFGGDEYRSDL